LWPLWSTQSGRLQLLGVGVLIVEVPPKGSPSLGTGVWIAGALLEDSPFAYEA